VLVEEWVQKLAEMLEVAMGYVLVEKLAEQ